MLSSERRTSTAPPIDGALAASGDRTATPLPKRHVLIDIHGLSDGSMCVECSST